MTLRDGQTETRMETPIKPSILNNKIVLNRSDVTAAITASAGIIHGNLSSLFTMYRGNINGHVHHLERTAKALFDEDFKVERDLF